MIVPASLKVALNACHRIFGISNQSDTTRFPKLMLSLNPDVSCHQRAQKMGPS